MKQEKIPFQVWILTLAAFAIGTAEFVIAGILPQIATSLSITEGQAGYLISAYALAIVIGGPILTIYLARFNKKMVLIGLMALFIIGNVLSALAPSYPLLLASRVIAGLVQGPFYGIGAVVATNLVSEKMAGRAVGQMFAGLTLANVLGVPAGTWVSLQFGWHTTFFTVAALGTIAMISILTSIKSSGHSEAKGIKTQLLAFKNPMLLISLAITAFAWSGFMTLYGYLAPIAIHITGYSQESVTWILVIVGVGLIIGNTLGGRSSDKDLGKASMFWAIAMIVSLVVVGLVVDNKILFVAAAFVFGIASFANVPAMQLRVMNHGGEGQELAATANISAFNLANAFGGFLGGMVLDSQLGAGMIPFAAVVVPVIGLLLIAKANRAEKPQNDSIFSPAESK
ncbi:MFS transporter, DHA1 family, inner membrane transport protein [Vibrio crassostreae]|uniref:MFS transporter n=1 Tax=Vibrio crassostreae TaxID=246167 RepID=UPI0010532D97|nr:MFS transporter [Vibrio crassostreae]TCN82668.1 DHA1 family inner membrane transport protein [Vibrio crassostreae]CAK2450055.1 MFS transporter, DHA1 family, inner membrane transport protein [Vibrio crassostreae]CAK3855120.1 MFS transporter, DHA1 family, inner membrane transport protein [Vibrio crassostreae]